VTITLGIGPHSSWTSFSISYALGSTRQNVSRIAAIRGRSVRAKISGEGVVPGGIFFGFYKTRHILLSDGANCMVLRAIVLTQYRRVTDGETHGIAVANAALAIRALLAMRALLNASIAVRCKNSITFQVSHHFADQCV